MHLFTHRFCHHKNSFFISKFKFFETHPFKSFCISLCKSTPTKYIQKVSNKKIPNGVHICYEVNDLDARSNELPPLKNFLKIFKKIPEDVILCLSLYSFF